MFLKLLVSSVKYIKIEAKNFCYAICQYMYREVWFLITQVSRKKKIQRKREQTMMEKYGVKYPGELPDH